MSFLSLLLWKWLKCASTTLICMLGKYGLLIYCNVAFLQKQTACFKTVRIYLLHFKSFLSEKETGLYVWTGQRWQNKELKARLRCLFLLSALEHCKSSLIVVILMLHYVKLSLLASSNAMALLWPEGVWAWGVCVHVWRGTCAHCIISRLIAPVQKSGRMAIRCYFSWIVSSAVL